MSDAKLPKPPAENPESAPFWQAARDGRLLLGHCAACGQSHYYPRRHCPACGASAIEWRDAAGQGTIYSFVNVARGPAGPFTMAYVELAEGPRIITHIVGGDPHAYAIGQPVRLQFVPSDGGPPYPAFTPF